MTSDTANYETRSTDNTNKLQVGLFYVRSICELRNATYSHSRKKMDCRLIVPIFHLSFSKLLAKRQRGSSATARVPQVVYVICHNKQKSDRIA